MMLKGEMKHSCDVNTTVSSSMIQIEASVVLEDRDSNFHFPFGLVLAL